MPPMMLTQAHVVRRWCSIVGSLEGCLQSLDLDHSPAFVMGASGHAFRINIEPTHICRTGPTVIDFRGDHLPLYNNLGVRFELRQHWTDEPTYRAKQRVVWEAVLDSLEARRPPIVWDADIPEFGLVIGHEPRGGRFTFSTMPQPQPWHASMNEVPRNVGMLRLFLPVERKNCDKRKAVYDSLAFAVRQSRAGCCYDNHLPGFSGYEAWIAAVREQRVLDDPYSHAYNAAVIYEARSLAVEYLREVVSLFEQPAGTHLSAAADAFEQVAISLREVHRLFPLPRDNEAPDPAVLPLGVTALEAAYKAEQRALAAIIRAYPEFADLEQVVAYGA